MSQSIIRFIRAHRLYEGGRAFSSTYGEVIVVGFTSDGYATVAPEAGACPFGDVPMNDLSPIGGES